MAAEHMVRRVRRLGGLLLQAHSHVSKVEQGILVVCSSSLSEEVPVQSERSREVTREGEGERGQCAAVLCVPHALVVLRHAQLLVTMSVQLCKVVHSAWVAHP